MRQNVLDQEASPYLLQHKDNPVHWQPWGGEALAAAESEDKPVLLSIGYSACHWCHVMAHESFEDPETARLMNELFVNIKVDREERPDLDAIYQLALAVMGQPGGWPLTMFLTSKGEPFWGGTYFPPTRQLGRPGFREVLHTVHDAYKNHPEKVTQNTSALRRALQEELRNRRGDGIDRELRDQAARRLLREVDMRFGGLGLAPKFPVPNMLEMLWRYWRRAGEEAARDAVTLSVERMCMGGIYDHLGGGFARYATDQRWLVPHFEKMLYDNALLIELMTHLWQDTKDPLFAVRIEETVDWVLREMTVEGGAFASALDADSAGEEGRFYVWDEAEIDRLLGEDSEAFKRSYDVTAEGNWEGRNILHRLSRNGLADAETEQRLARLRRVLFAARERRERPSWDDSVLVDWNGLMISALASAGTVFENPTWLAAAMQAFDFISTQMAANGRLCHSGRKGRVKRVEFLDDYANMARAALLLHELTGSPEYLARAERWVGTLDAHYWDAENGGYFYTPDDGETVITRAKTARDQASPSGNGVMVEVLARLFYLTGKDSYRERAASLVAAFAGEVPLNLPTYATLINNNELLEEATQIVIMGEREARETRALLHAVFDVSLPNRVLMVIPPEASLPSHHPAAGKSPVESRATAYVCKGTRCSLPVTKPAELKESLLPPTNSGT